MSTLTLFENDSQLKNPAGGITDSKQFREHSQVERAATPKPATWINPHMSEASVVEVYENEINIRAKSTVQFGKRPPKRKKNDITGFSKKSRLRQLRKFNRLQSRRLSKPLFITITGRNTLLSPEQFRDLIEDEFISKARNLIPELVYAWRMELHKSGYPHFHMFFWSERKDFPMHTQNIAESLHLIAFRLIDDMGPDAWRHGFDYEFIDSKRKAFAYVAKYTAKVATDEDTTVPGRRWAVSSNFPASPITTFEVSAEEQARLRQLAYKLLKESDRMSDYLEMAFSLNKNLFVWLNLDEITQILSKFDLPPPFEAVNTYRLSA